MARHPELLIPASSLEVLKTAVVFGADAVYIGGEAFGLRAKAKNFSKEDMMEGAVLIGDDIIQGFIVMFCHGDNKGIYYWDDAYNFQNSDDENNMYWIANSFNEFIKLLS